MYELYNIADCVDISGSHT